MTTTERYQEAMDSRLQDQETDVATEAELEEPEQAQQPAKLAKRQEQKIQRSEPMSIQPRNMEELARVSAMCFSARGSFVPSHFKSAAEIGAAIMLGQEIGMGVMQTLQAAYVVNGNVGFHYSVNLGIIRSRGYDVEYLNQSDVSVTMLTTAPNGKTFKITWDKERAERNGLWGNRHWKKDPETMLIARCVSHTLRQFVGVKIYDQSEIWEMGGQEHGTAEEAANSDINAIAVMNLEAKREDEENFTHLLKALTDVKTKDDFFDWLENHIYEYDRMQTQGRLIKKLWKQTKVQCPIRGEGFVRVSVEGKMAEFEITDQEYRDCLLDAKSRMEDS